MSPLQFSSPPGPVALSNSEAGLQGHPGSRLVQPPSVVRTRRCDRCRREVAYLTDETYWQPVHIRGTVRFITSGSRHDFCDDCYGKAHPELELHDVEGFYGVWWNPKIGMSRGTRMAASSILAGSNPERGDEWYAPSPERGQEEPNMGVFDKPTATAPPPTTTPPAEGSVRADLERMSSGSFLNAKDIGQGTKLFHVKALDYFETKDRSGNAQRKPVLKGHLDGETEECGLVLNVTNLSKLAELGMDKYSELFGHKLELGTYSTQMGPGIVIVKAVP